MSSEGISRRSLYVRYALIMFLFYFTVSMTAYISVYLQEQGLSSTQIGTVVAISGIIAAVLLPLWGMLSDRLQSARTSFVICCASAAIAFLLVPATSKIFIGPVALSIIFLVINLAFRGPSNNLVVSWMARESTFNKINYSSVRLWGSIGFSAMLLLLSAIIPSTGTIVIFYLTAALTVVQITVCYTVKEDKIIDKKKVTLKELKVGRIFTNYYFMLYLALVVAMVIYDAITMTYMPFLITAIGANTASTGLIIGTRALFEMLIMLVVIFFKKRVPLTYLLIAAGVLFGIEHMLYPLSTAMLHIVLISMISGVASGVFLGLGPSYVLSIVPPELNNTAQTVWGSAMMGTLIVASFAGGILVDRIGIKRLLFGCGIVILAITACFALSLFLGMKVFRLKTPESVYKPITKIEG